MRIQIVLLLILLIYALRASTPVTTATTTIATTILCASHVTSSKCTHTHKHDQCRNPRDHREQQEWNLDAPMQALNSQMLKAQRSGWNSSRTNFALFLAGKGSQQLDNIKQPFTQRFAFESVSAFVSRSNFALTSGHKEVTKNVFLSPDRRCPLWIQLSYKLCFGAAETATTTVLLLLCSVGWEGGRKWGCMGWCKEISIIGSVQSITVFAEVALGLLLAPGVVVGVTIVAIARCQD